MLIWDLVVLFGVPVVLAAGWLWICLGIVKTGVRRVIGAVALQLSYVTAIIGLLHGHGSLALFQALLPPVTIPYSFGYLASFKLFLDQVLPGASAVGAIVLVAFLAVPKLRLWCIAPALLAFLFAAIAVGERVSQRAMCTTAEAAGVKEFWREPLHWTSLNEEGRGFGSYFHAVAEVNGLLLGWSYKSMSWYEMRPMPWYKMRGPLFNCGALAGASP